MTTAAFRGELASWQLLDWRFVLPAPNLGQVAVGEGVSSGLRLALVQSGHQVVDLAAAAGQLDSVVLTDSSAQEIGAAFALLRPTGVIYMQVRRRPARAVTAIPRTRWSAWTALLRDGGFEAVSAYWSIPDLDRQSLVVPLSSAHAARAALERRGSTTRGRVKARVLQLAWLLRAGSLTAREGFMVARRPEKPR